MGKVIELKLSTSLERIWERSIEDIKPKTIDEYVNETMKVKWEVNKILDTDVPIVMINENELLIILKTTIREELIRWQNLNADLFLCGEYVGYIIHKCLMWNFKINQYTQDFFEENAVNFKWAWDINLLKYIYEFHKRKHEVNTPKDYIERAWTMYYNAYDRWQMELWYTLAYHLEELDSKVGLMWLTQRIFDKREFRIQTD